MYETMIARSILEVLTYRITSRNQPCSAASVNIMVGELRNVNVDGLLFAFDSIKQNYPHCARCELVASRAAASARCRAGHNYQPKGNAAYCTECGESMAELIHGQELEITNITVLDSAGVHLV
ncbi:MAG: hydrogenase maturation nickel metallochaperone HypA [Candidatus Obscuribacterales bacterium]|nr:hydrogenase maturation nickel metallochaperone HypA [Candidatus Obscuribacterales bacterium]